MTDLTTHLHSLGACPDAIDWAQERPLSAATWRACKRGDWLLWYVARIGVGRALLVRAACLCARESLRYVDKGELRPLRAIETAERWCEGKATLAEVRAAAAAADAYDYADAAAASAAYAADAYADAAAASAAYAADAYADAADAYADDDAARSKSLARSATLVRRVIPWSVCEKAMVQAVLDAKTSARDYLTTEFPDARDMEVARQAALGHRALRLLVERHTEAIRLTGECMHLPNCDACAIVRELREGT